MYIADYDGGVAWFDETHCYKKGDLVIKSNYDNSIPYIIYHILDNLSWNKPPVIEDINIKDVTRIHLG